MVIFIGRLRPGAVRGSKQTPRQIVLVGDMIAARIMDFDPVALVVKNETVGFIPAYVLLLTVQYLLYRILHIHNLILIRYLYTVF